MLSIRPVLLVGTGDVSDLCATLRALGCGTMLAPSVDQASLMLRHFRVDAIVALRSRAEDLRALSKFRTPLILVGGDSGSVGDLKCAFASEHLDSTELGQVVMRVINGHRRIFAGREPAKPHAAAAAYETDHSRRR
jgi:hypothetical protein